MGVERGNAMKAAFDLLRAVAWLWVCLFSLGTLLLVIFAPLFVPAVLFVGWLWRLTA